MSKLTFAQDVNTLKYLYTDQLEYLLHEHNITKEEVGLILKQLGFQEIVAEPLEQEDE